jgi:ABC-type cobalt transport system substrate-binding protein
VGKSYLDETNVGALLAEALTADVQAILADETSRVGADAAVSTSLATVPMYKPRYSPIYRVGSGSEEVITYHSREPLP